MIRLIQNENMKIYKKVGTWIMLGLIIIVVVIAGIVSKFLLHDQSIEGENWKQQLEIRNEQMQEEIAQLENTILTSNAAQPLREDVLLNEYRLENNIPPVESETLWGFMISAPDFTAFASMLAIVVGAGIVASEFTTGTIKLLLIRPVNRFKILLSKFIATLLFAFVLIITLFISSFIVGSLLYGFKGMDLPYLVYVNGEIVERHMLTQIVSLYGFNSIDLIMMVTFAFMISTVFRSSSLAIGLSLFLMFTGQQMVMLLSQYNWVKYILFANTNLMQYTRGTPLVEGMTMSFSVTILFVYFLLFTFISWLIFEKRDVTA
ncbi:MAG: ABC transporter permease [Bacillus sp. (in: Bacteria)]|nr:ABC transporter permease [Bacillus sp. (in: firmicutes)]